MSPSLSLLLHHYRHILAEAVDKTPTPGAPSCPPGEELRWAERGEGEGWLTREGAMAVRRLARRVRFYEQRATSLEER
ncbi:MAG TPA: hypothetical protein VFI13_08810 [Gemmatimonadales bacterium]|nr:hypothetical protein [Gemmatimonadales bacterium]